MRIFKFLPVVGLLLLQYLPLVHAGVTLTQSTFEWKVYNYSVNSDYSLGSGPDYNTVVKKDFKSYILENEYLKVTVVPEFGGRIVSMIYKPTGHEELYHPQIGHPQAKGQGSFYFDWLIVLGGISPTLTAPEHGKYWMLPWSVDIVEQTNKCISIKMSQIDSVVFNRCPQRFAPYGKTGITCSFTVSLSEGKTSVDIGIINKNPGSAEQSYEYWTCTAMAPGSDPADPRINGNTELQIPIDKVRIVDDWCQSIKQVDQSLGNNLYTFNKLRYFKNWPDMGILYAPENFSQNYWGVINHDDPRNEGIFRICDNKETKGVKIWAWEYQTAISKTPIKNGLMHQPFFEVWGGVSDRFFTQVKLAAGATKEWVEHYSPVVGIDSITHASEDVLLKFRINKKSFDGATDTNVTISCDLFSVVPKAGVFCTIQFENTDAKSIVYSKEITPDMVKGNSILLKVPCREIYNGFTRVCAVITNKDGREMINAKVDGLQFVHCSNETPVSIVKRNNFSNITQECHKNNNVTLYSSNGKRIGTIGAGKRVSEMSLPEGIYFIRNLNGTISRLVQIH